MHRFSIRQILGAILIVAVSIAAFRAITVARHQKSEIKNLNQWLDDAERDQQILTNSIVQCQTDERLSRLNVCQFLRSYGWHRYRVSVSNLSITKSLDLIAFVTIVPEFRTRQEVSSVDKKHLGRALLLIYNLDENVVVDAMTTEDYGGYTWTGQPSELQLDLPQQSETIIATSGGFILLP